MATPLWPLEGVALETDGAAVAGSLAYRILRMYDDAYAPVFVYPTLAAGATVVTPVANWTLGNLATVVPINTIHNPFLIHIVTIETLTAVGPDTPDGVYELVIYAGPADSEVARVRFSITGGFFGNSVYRLPSALVPANSVVKAALAASTGGGGAKTATISIAYREVV
jgi:hypothetical protein